MPAETTHQKTRDTPTIPSFHSRAHPSPPHIYFYSHFYSSCTLKHILLWQWWGFIYATRNSKQARFFFPSVSTDIRTKSIHIYFRSPTDESVAVCFFIFSLKQRGKKKKRKEWKKKRSAEKTVTRSDRRREESPYTFVEWINICGLTVASVCCSVCARWLWFGCLPCCHRHPTGAPSPSPLTNQIYV